MEQRVTRPASSTILPSIANQCRIGNGGRLALLKFDKQAPQLYDFANDALLHKLHCPSDNDVILTDLTEDGLVASLSAKDSREACLWYTASPEMLGKIGCTDAGPLLHHSLSCNGTFATLCYNGRWDIMNLVTQRTVSIATSSSEGAVLFSAVCSDNLAVIGTSSCVRVWQLEWDQSLATLHTNFSVPNDGAANIQLVCDGSILAYSAGKDIYLHDMPMLRSRTAVFNVFSDDIIAQLRVSPCSTKALASPTTEPVIALIDVPLRCVVATFHHHTDVILDLAWLTDIAMFASVARDGTLKTWQTRTLHRVASSAQARSLVAATANVKPNMQQHPFSATGPNSGANTTAGKINRSSADVSLPGPDSNESLPEQAPDGSSAPEATMAALSTCLRYIAYGTSDRIDVWDTGRLSMVWTHANGGAAISAVDIHSQSIVVTGHLDGHIRLWDHSGMYSERRLGHQQALSICQLCDKGNRLLTWAKDDATAIVWQVANQQEIARLAQPNMLQVAVADNGETAATASSSVLQVWSVGTGDVTHRFDCAAIPSALSLSSLGAFVASVCTRPGNNEPEVEVRIHSLLDNRCVSRTILPSRATLSAPNLRALDGSQVSLAWVQRRKVMEHKVAIDL
eukprot:TRINITY_DN17365_c0_g1_i1.p1 TRINITY_DN17365_c0_g1~~TRINITY_DN17365_c0_g1_i1.p1  ORF type:complete len:626 (+),score=53.65 TRINITY_DN17365_c0_g1_i1:106-1983(+)